MKIKIKLFARNIVNPEAITDFISKIAKSQSDKIKVWCNTILKNYLKNEYDNLKEVTKAKKTDPTWLQEAVKRKDAQMLVIDNNFERLLIEHIFHYFDTLQSASIKHSFSEAQKQTKEWENKENIFNIKLTKGVKEVLKCSDGYTWFEITDEETLYNEGEVLQNCMRKKEHGKNYWIDIEDNNIKIFTLRDNKGIGHVGVEYIISENEIEQMLGKQNDEPIKIYHPFCIELIKYLKCFVPGKITKYLNIAIDSNNKLYDLFNLPKDLKFKGDFYLADTNIDIELPENLSVSGTLNLSDSNIKLLPDNLKIGNSLFLENSKVTKLPKNLKIAKFLSIRKTNIIELPKDLKVDGDIDASESSLNFIPDNFKVNGYLDLNESKITKLPNGLQIKDFLSLRETNITELPKDLKVGNDIDTSYSKLKFIPDNFNINGDLYLYKTLITKLPKKLKIKKNLYLYEASITELPNDLEVGEFIFVDDIKKIKNRNKFLKKLKSK